MGPEGSQRGSTRVVAPPRGHHCGKGGDEGGDIVMTSQWHHRHTDAQRRHTQGGGRVVPEGSPRWQRLHEASTADRAAMTVVPGGDLLVLPRGRRGRD